MATKSISSLSKKNIYVQKCAEKFYAIFTRFFQVIQTILRQNNHHVVILPSFVKDAHILQMNTFDKHSTAGTHIPFFGQESHVFPYKTSMARPSRGGGGWVDGRGERCPPFIHLEHIIYYTIDLTEGNENTKPPPQENGKSALRIPGVYSFCIFLQYSFT